MKFALLILILGGAALIAESSDPATATGSLTSPVPPPLGTAVNSWFDHHLPGQLSSSYLPFQRYDGYEDSSSNALCTGPTTCYCTLGVNCYNGHSGIDLNTNDGSNGGYGYPIVAATAGYVQQVTYSSSGLGTHVRLWHASLGYSTVYAHLQSIQVQQGQNVSRGDLVGYSGCSGACYGAHLHFGAYDAQSGGDPIDPFGWADPDGPDDPWTPDRDYRYLWATRIGVRQGNGNLVTKEGTLSAGWYNHSVTVSDLAMSGSRIGRVTNSRGYVKDGSQSAGWVYEICCQVTSVEVAGRRIAFIDGGYVEIKEGNLHAGWHQNFLADQVLEVALTYYRNSSGQLVDRVGVLTTDRVFKVKEGPLNASWTTVASDVLDIAMADDRIGLVKTSGKVYVKEGPVSAGWAHVASGAVAAELGGRGSNKRIGVVKPFGDAFVKEGPVGAGWRQLTPGDNVSRLQLNSARVGVLTWGGLVRVKEGSVYCSDAACPWVTEASGSDLRLN